MVLPPFVGLLLAASIAPVVAVPHDAPFMETVYGSVNATSDLTKRQATAIDFGCTYASGDVNQNRRDAAEQIAEYLEGLSSKGVRCGLDKKQPYYNLLTVTINGQGYEANLYFTGRIPQTTAADYACKDLATELRNLQSRCRDETKGADSILEWTWLLNCIASPTFSSPPPQPYTEGGSGLEFREAGYPSPNHAD